MYSLDVNFLNDRSERPIEPIDQGRQADPGDRRPLFVGVGVAVVALAFVGGIFAFSKWKEQQLEAELAVVEQELAALQQQIQKVERINAQIAEIEGEVTSLVTVFDQIRPWSAMLQDVRERIPARVQIESIKQMEVEEEAAPAPADGAAADGTETPALPQTSGVIEIGGLACTFDDVNDFLLTLKSSPLLEAEETDLVGATLQEGSEVKVGKCPGDQGEALTVKQLVEYTITSELTNIPASDLIQEFERRGTVGLVSRLRALKAINSEEGE